VGDAVDERLGYGRNVEVTKIGADVPDHILLAGQWPKPRDLQRLLDLLGKKPLCASSLDGRWALQREGGDESLLRFNSDYLYLVRTKHTPPIYEKLAAVAISGACQ
jgi:hypothetical protein